MIKENINQLLKLKNEIIELKKIKTYIKQKELEIEKNVKKYSTYNSLKIANIIAKLMTEFEGITYISFKDDDFFEEDKHYKIKPKNNNAEVFYLTYRINNIKKKTPIYYKEKNIKTNNEELCYLPPSPLNKNNNSSYIQDFIDYLYEKRANNNIEKIDDEKLEEILQEYLSITKEKQHQRQVEIINQITEKKKKLKRKEFEIHCLVDRNLIYNSLIYIINKYEKEITASKKTTTEWSRSNSWSELYVYQDLIINFNNEKIIYRAVIDHNGCYEDEEYCGVGIDINKNTNINFFDLKNKLVPITNTSENVKDFFNMVENLYTKTNTATLDDIHQILVTISNKNKEKQKIIKK